MPNSAYLEAIKQAWATARTDVTTLETVQIHHPEVSPDFFLVNDMTDKVCTLENDEEKTFIACPFRLKLPDSGEGGIQSLSLAIDNTDRAISDFINKIKTSRFKTEVTYRPYLSDDLTAPQMVPPLRLFLSDIVATQVEVTAKSSFADLINKKFATALYTRKRFPSLGNL